MMHLRVRETESDMLSNFFPSPLVNRACKRFQRFELMTANVKKYEQNIKRFLSLENVVSIYVSYVFETSINVHIYLESFEFVCCLK